MLTMMGKAGAAGAALVLMLAIGLLVAGWFPFGGPRQAEATALAAKAPPRATKPGPPPVPQPPPVEQVLRNGVLIVVSTASQTMFVFKDGDFWDQSPVSTGMRGHATPTGIFPILQKAVYHRSNIYSGAPMPYMQRLTWSGIAIHAGYLPGYPASHGCIRLPKAFARKLFGLTKAGSTTVVITGMAARSDSRARELALAMPGPRPTTPAAASVPQSSETPRIEPQPLVPVQSQVGGQTIQLAAAATPAEADAAWARLVALHPELRLYQKVVIPAVVGKRQVYRLRASAPDAHAFCSTLKRGGEDCFNVN